MGISTFQSYCGAQIFDAIGLSSKLVQKYFTGTATMIEGIGLDEIAAETSTRHGRAYADDRKIDVGGNYAWRVGGEAHAWSPDTVANLQHAVRGNLPEKYRDFAAGVNDQSRRLLTIRGLLNFKPLGPAVALDDVEPASEIVKRFSTGAMSFGSISREAHSTLAIAMNRIGGKSNTGEGGESATASRRSDGDSCASISVRLRPPWRDDDLSIRRAADQFARAPARRGRTFPATVAGTVPRAHSTPGVG